MADDIVLNSGSGGDTIAADDDGTRKWPYSKIAFGADNTQTIVGSISSNPFPVALSDTDNAVLDSIQTAVEIIDNSVYVDDADWTALSSSHNLIGGIYQSTPGTITDGDTGPIRLDANGAIHINDGGNTITVDGTVTANLSATDNAVLDNIQTAVEIIDDAVYVDDADWTALSSKHALIGGVYQSSPGTITDGDTGPLRVDPNGHLITSAHAASVALSDDVSNTANLLVDEADAFIATATFGYYFDGSTWDRMRGDATNGLTVNLGTNNDVTVSSQPARDNATDTITASLDTAAIMNDTTALTPKFAAVNATVSGDNTVVAAVVGKKVRVLSYSLVADAAVGVAFEDGAGGTELSGQMAFAANGGISVPFSPVGHFETTANTILNIELDAAANVRGHVAYVEV